MKIGGKDPINLKQFLVWMALGVVLALIWVLIDPALAIVLGIGAVGTWLVVGMRLKPRWIKAFWAWCIRFGQDPYSIRWWSYLDSERQSKDSSKSSK
tara:strand:- start:139 stop:429 length:291 start_codon:yes stop_codon:yes gene_type:complete